MIHKLEFSIELKADVNSIWKALWDEDSYRDWSGVFFEGSFAITDNWKEGSTVQFLSPDNSGIYSLIEKHLPTELIVFKHLGLVKDGKELAIDEETKKWSGATEIYKLSKGTNSTTLSVEIDVLDEHLDFMNQTFPKALERIKTNCR